MNFKIWLFKEEITPEQNSAFKQLYIIIRDVLFDLKQQIDQQNYTINDVNDYIKFCRDFGRVGRLYRPSKNAKGWKPSGCGIEILIPDMIKNAFPSLATPFYLGFPVEESEAGGLVIHGWGENKGKSDEMRINIFIFMKDPDAYKATIQHELQHLLDVGTAPDESEENALIRARDYLCHSGEVSAYAKESAYRYYKMFPQDASLDFNKFKQNFYKKKISGSVDTLIHFGEDLERLKNKFNLTPQQIEELKSCYNKFVLTLTKYFLYFKNQPSKAS